MRQWGHFVRVEESERGDRNVEQRKDGSIASVNDPSLEPTRRRLDDVSSRYAQHRPELTRYVTRLVVRPAIAEELVQEAALRTLGELESVSALEGEAFRRWLFRVVTNLAIDHLRRHATWREDLLLEAQLQAVADQGFLDESNALRGTPEMRNVAREHLAVCLSCTTRSLSAESAAALWLKEVYGFSLAETAELLGDDPVRTKNALQSARAELRRRYASTCALVNQAGACHQCVQLDEHFNGERRDPLAATDKTIVTRLRLVREQRDEGLGPWHILMMRLVDEILES